MAERFFLARAASQATDRLVLEGDEAHHLARVRRMGIGATVEVFDGQGFATLAEVTAVARGRVEMRPFGPPLPDPHPAVRLTLATAVPKGERFDWLVEKATEVGVDRLVPVLTKRAVVHPGPAKLDRLRRTVIEAAKQCGRNRLMTIDEPAPWPSVVGAHGPEVVRLLADPDGSPIEDWTPPAPRGRVVVAIGPEGGFTAV